MAFAEFQGIRFKIDGEIAENHAILGDHFQFDGEYTGVFRGLFSLQKIEIWHSKVTDQKCCVVFTTNHSIGSQRSYLQSVMTF